MEAVLKDEKAEEAVLKIIEALPEVRAPEAPVSKSGGAHLKPAARPKVGAPQAPVSESDGGHLFKAAVP